nr:efflux RND transporter permease subunit [Candidatus Sumerlaeota bacterium]
MSSAPLNPPPPRDAQPHGPLAWLVHNRVTPNLMMLVLLVGGVLTALSIKQEVFPEFSADQISIRVAYPGAGPEEVENGIILVIEEAVRAIEGIVEMQSTAREGSADVMLEIEPNGDHQKIYTDVQQAIARIRTFPDDAEEPQIELVTRRRDVLEVQLYGDVDEFTLRNIAEEVRDRLLQ